MATIQLRSREQILGDLIRTILINSDLTDVAPGSTLATTLESIAASEYQISVSVLKILEASNLESQVGVNLDREAESLGIPNGVGGKGRKPAIQASGIVQIGSGFSAISSKSYAGKPAPFAGSKTLYLEDASGFSATGNIYIARGTANRFEGPIAYTSVTNNVSYWTIELSSPLTKSHIYSDIVLMAHGGDRTIPAGTIVLIPANSAYGAISYRTNSAITIFDGESTGQVGVTCTSFGETGNALAGAINSFSTLPFPAATVTNLTSFSNGKSTESDEDLRDRIRNFPSTLSRGTKLAIIGAIQGASDPDSGRTITSVFILEPAEAGDSSKVYIDDGTGLEPTFDVQPYELLLRSASGQETFFRTAQSPITPAVALGAQSAPFVLQDGQTITIAIDGVSETYRINEANYSNINAATVYEVIRDFNSQTNIASFRSIEGGNRLAVFDKSGKGEIMSIDAGELQTIFGLTTSLIRPIYVYEDSVIKSFRGETATLVTNAFPWDVSEADMENVRVSVDGVIETFSIRNVDFAEFGTTLSNATLTQWQTVFSRKIAGVKFTLSQTSMVWSTYQTLSSSGSLEILTTKADGLDATWIGQDKVWNSSGKLFSQGANKEFEFNRFTGEIRLLNKPAAGTTIEIGSGTTRAQIASVLAPTGLYSVSPISPGIGNSKLVIGFDGEFAIREVTVPSSAQVTPSQPDAVNAINIIRLTANTNELFKNVQVGDFLYLVQHSLSTWGDNIEGVYRLNRVGMNGSPVNVTYLNLSAKVTDGSTTVTVTQPEHGFKSGAQIVVSTSSPIGGISYGDLSQTAIITVLTTDTYTYEANASATGDGTGVLAFVTYNADTWVEFEVSSVQLSDWLSILSSQNIYQGMISLFKSEGAIPQVVDFGTSASLSVDDVVTLINSNISGGTAIKVNPRELTVRSNNFENGTVAILATVGDSANIFSTGTASGIQSHIANISSDYVQGGFPVISSIVNQTDAASGYATRSSLFVDKMPVDIFDTAINPSVRSSAGVITYPEGFEQVWITGRLSGLTGRVYSAQKTAPFQGVMRGKNTILPLQTFDSTQTNTTSYDRYSNYSLKLNDLPITEVDRLVVEMDLDPTNKTISVALFKTALIQEINTLTGSGKGQIISFKLKDPDDLDISSQPRPFFNNESIYKNFDFSDFKMLTKNVGIYQDESPLGNFASGSIGSLAAGGASGILDGDTFTLKDGINDPVTFEFDSNSSVGSGNVSIPIVLGNQETGSLLAVGEGTGSNPGIRDGDTFTLNDGINAPVAFEFDNGNGVSYGNIAVPFTPGVQATGSLVAFTANATTGIKDGDTFTLNDGVNPSAVFEFDISGIGDVALGHIAVPITYGSPETGSITAIAEGYGSHQGIRDGDTFTINDGVHSAVVFEFDTNSSVISGHIAVPFTPGVQATGHLTAVAADPTTGIKYGDTFTINDGNSDLVFEFNSSSGTLGGIGHIRVTLASTTDFNWQVADAIRLAINNSVSFSAIADVPLGIAITNLAYSHTGNVAITQSISNGATLTPVGMTGGVDFTTASSFRSAMVIAITWAQSNSLLNVTPSAGINPSVDIKLTNTVNGNFGHAISSFLHSGGVIPHSGFSGGVNQSSSADVQAAIISAINGVPSSLNITASSGLGVTVSLTSDDYTSAANNLIYTYLQNSYSGVTLSQSGMSGGVNLATASTIKASMLNAINGVSPSLNIAASSGSGNIVNLLNQVSGAFGHAITQNLFNGTLTPVGFLNGVNPNTASVVKEYMITAINTAGLHIQAIPSTGNTIILFNTYRGAMGNLAITESLHNAVTLNPVGMLGGTDVSESNRAAILRSTAYGSPSRLRMSIRYATSPDVSDFQITHVNDFQNGTARCTLVVNLPTSSIVAGSLLNSGTYTITVTPEAGLYRISFVAAGLNSGGQYTIGNILNVGGKTDLAGAYQIVSAAPGMVDILAPGTTTLTSLDASINPLNTYPLSLKTFTDLQTAINAYYPQNPIATIEVIGDNIAANHILNPTYIAYQKPTAAPSGSTMSQAFDYHSFETKYAGSAGIYVYDSSPSVNIIRALNQSDDSIFPTTEDIGTTNYSPINEEVRIVPTNSKTLDAWFNFSAASSLSISANIERINSGDNIQISSKENGSVGAVQVTGVTGNSLESFIIGNATSINESIVARILFADAQSIPRNSLVKIENSITSEIFRPYRTLPVDASITAANTVDDYITFFRQTNSIKYTQLSGNSARITFLRNGLGQSQTEPAVVGDQITFTRLGGGSILVRVTYTPVNVGLLSARVGDMMYIRPDSTTFPSSLRCKSVSGITSISSAGIPEYLGYPVVNVEDDYNIIIIASNISSSGAYTLATATDLVFVPSFYNEKNIRTNYKEGIQFDSPSNSYESMYVVVKALGGNMVSIFIRNSDNEATDTMLLSGMSVNTDDFAVLGDGFDIENRGTFKIVAHNGRNHLIVYNPNGGKDEILNTSTLEDGGVGSRKWGVGSITSPRPIRVLDSECVQVGDKLRISHATTSSQWFPDSMIGSFAITNMGFIGASDAEISPYIDIEIPDAPASILDGNSLPVSDFLLGANNTSIGFVEQTPFYGFRLVGGHCVNIENSEDADIFLLPKIAPNKMAESFGTRLTCLYRAGFLETAVRGIDGYKVYSGLVREAHRIIDGSPDNTIVYPGVRAAGTVTEVLPPLIRAVQVSLVIHPKDGVSLNSISEVVKSTVAQYINGLGIGQAVILSEIISIVQNLPGVLSVTIASTLPSVKDDRIDVSDFEKAFVLNINTDIVVG